MKCLAALLILKTKSRLGADELMKDFGAYMRCTSCNRSYKQPGNQATTDVDSDVRQTQIRASSASAAQIFYTFLIKVLLTSEANTLLQHQTQ